MLSGVASDQEIHSLTKALSSAELMRMMNLIQSVLAGFTRSASRRMDAELCLLEMCRPELSLDAKALNARLTRLEEQLKSGSFVPAAPVKNVTAPSPEKEDGDRPPLPDDADAPPIREEDSPIQHETPIGFWSELVASVRKELKPPASGFFVASPNAPVQGKLHGDRLELRCSNDFTAKMLDRSDILEVVSRKAGAMLGRPIRVSVVDITARPQSNGRMEQLMNFGRAHSDIVKIKNN